MPSVPLRTATAAAAAAASASSDNPLPSLLHTPRGLAVVEIQGTIRGQQHRQDDLAESSSGEMGQTGIGRLEFPLYTPQTPDDPDDTEWMKKVYFYVGKHQRLTGEVKKLAKPLAIIQTVEEGCSDEGGGSALEIRDVVKYKILFGGRPEPVGGE